MDFWNEVPGREGASLEPARPLSTTEIDTLWRLFAAIPKQWDVVFNVDLLRSRWNDMIEARSGPPIDKREAYINAAAVFAALESSRTDDCLQLIFVDTVISTAKQNMTRLEHAKLFVVNEFIRCFVTMGGFHAFVREGRNYAAFLGGSRFRDWPPVRTGPRT